MDLFKSKKKLNQYKAQEKPVDAEETSSTEEVRTTLSLDPTKKIKQEDQFIYQFYNNEAQPLKKNQLSIFTMDAEKTGDSIIVKGLVRQTLNKAIELKETEIGLINQDHEVIGKQTFDLSGLGQIPALSSRPWTFDFNASNITNFSEVNSDEVSVVFILKQQHRLDIEQKVKETMSTQQVEALERVVEQAPKLKPGEVNFMGIQANKIDQGIAVALLIRNGSEKNVQLEQLPLELIDKSNTTVAKGSFKLNDFTVKANTSKLHTFIFPESLITTETYDLSSFKVRPVQ